MTNINTREQLVTVINVFTVEPAKQQALVDLLTRATDETMAIGGLAIGALALKRGSIRTLSIDDVTIGRLSVRELAIDR